jgi:hypothetical protein
MLATRIALGLWNAGLVSQDALIAWVDGRIRASDTPSSELLELSWDGPVVCLKRPEFEFPARPIRFTFVEEFSLRALALDISDDLDAAQFVAWVSHCCMGEDPAQPEVSLGYQLDHLRCDCDDKPSAMRLLRVELPRLMPRCHALVSVLLAEVPDIALQRSSGTALPGR